MLLFNRLFSLMFFLHKVNAYTGRFLSEVWDTVGLNILDTVNSSLVLGLVPTYYKQAVADPLFKKVNLDATGLLHFWKKWFLNNCNSFRWAQGSRHLFDRCFTVKLEEFTSTSANPLWSPSRLSPGDNVFLHISGCSFWRTKSLIGYLKKADTVSSIRTVQYQLWSRWGSLIKHSKVKIEGSGI